jgi:hypothetical protein
MVTRKHSAGQASVRTLTAARELLHREWPGSNPSVSVLLAHHRRAAVLFDQVAEIDSDHHHEALVLAQQERETAQALAEQMAASAETSDTGSDTAGADSPAGPGGSACPHE